MSPLAAQEPFANRKLSFPLSNEMNRAESKKFVGLLAIFNEVSFRWIVFCLSIVCIGTLDLRSAIAQAAMQTGAAPSFNVTGFTVEGRWILSTNVMVPIFSKYSGANVSLENIIHAASDLELEYIREGYPTMNIVVAPKRITNGIVTLDVFPGAVAQVVVAGNRYLIATNGIVAAPPLLAIPPTTAPPGLAQKS